MNSFQMAWRSMIRKPIKSILLFFVVLIISLFFYLSWLAEMQASPLRIRQSRQ